VVAGLDDLSDQVEEIRAAVEMLYDMIRDQKDDGATYDELIEATGFARGTLQNIVDGRSPKIWP
jgi:hypothetical protein